MISTVCRTFSSRRGARSRGARPRGQLWHYALALEHRAFLQFSKRRDLREKAFRAWAARGENGGATDNRAIAAEMVRPRAERARLLGYESFAHFRLADTMAKTPQAALDLLAFGVGAGRFARAKEEAALQAIVAGEGGNFKVAPWDWRYLRGEAAQGRVRSRRRRDQALFAARPDHRGGVLCGEPPVRPRISQSDPIWAL